MHQTVDIANAKEYIDEALSITMHATLSEKIKIDGATTMSLNKGYLRKMETPQTG